MRSYPWAAWRGAIVTAMIVAGLSIATEFHPDHAPSQWALAPEYVAFVLFLVAPVVVFFFAARED